MAYVLVGEVGHTHDGTLLDGELHVRVLIELDVGNLEPAGLILLDDLGFVDFHFLHFEGAADDVEVVSEVLLQVGFLFGCLKHAEDVVLLHVPDATLGECFQCECFFLVYCSFFFFHIVVVHVIWLQK